MLSVIWLGVGEAAQKAVEQAGDGSEELLTTVEQESRWLRAMKMKCKPCEERACNMSSR